MRKDAAFLGDGIRLIATDLDDTLERGDKSLSAYTQEIFARCKEQGIRTAIVTARLLASTEREQALLNPDLRIVSGGGMALLGDEILFFQGMGKEETSAFLAVLQERGAEGLLAGCMRRMYTNSGRFARSATLHTALYHDFKEPLGEEACQIFFRLQDESGAEELKKSFPGFEWLLYRDGTYAVMAKGVSKMQALRRAAGMYGIDTGQIAAFGDDEGDCEMLRQCGVGVAVENALPCAKEAASFITGSNEEDGVARFVEQYILSGGGKAFSRKDVGIR